MGIKKQYIPVLSVPRVRSKLNDIWKLGSDSINSYCLRFLTDDVEDQCLICYEPYFKPRELITMTRLHQCLGCFELYHEICHKKWSCNGEGCARCKYKKTIYKGREDIIWPVQ